MTTVLLTNDIKQLRATRGGARIPNLHWGSNLLAAFSFSTITCQSGISPSKRRISRLLRLSAKESSCSKLSSLASLVYQTNSNIKNTRPLKSTTKKQQRSQAANNNQSSGTDWLNNQLLATLETRRELTCIASVSARVRGKSWDESKKKGMTGEGEGREVSSFPLPFPVPFFLLPL